MVSFREKMEVGLAKRKIEVSSSLEDTPYQSILVIGGWRQLGGLWKARQKGIRIVQRLDGMNWLHRLNNPVTSQRSTLRHTLRAEVGNWLLAFTRRHIAHHIVYQSHFVQRWWEQVYGVVPASHSIVYNGIDLQQYTPQGEHQRPGDRLRLLMVEGSLMGGYELGMEVVVSLAQKLQQWLDTHTVMNLPTQIDVMVVGKAPADLRSYWNQRSSIPIQWQGIVPRADIPFYDRSAHLFYASDIHPACPNAVIEALACGLPVVAFDTGAVKELVTEKSGRVVGYGGNPWKLESPDVDGLALAAREILCDLDRFRKNARQHAEQCFDLEQMIDTYLDVLL